LVWDLTSTNDNTKAINAVVKDISNIQKDHKTEVDRSKDVDADQEIEIKDNRIELRRQLGFIHTNDTNVKILLDRSDRDYKDLPRTDFNK